MNEKIRLVFQENICFLCTFQSTSAWEFKRLRTSISFFLVFFQPIRFDSNWKSGSFLINSIVCILGINFNLRKWFSISYFVCVFLSFRLIFAEFCFSLMCLFMLDFCVAHARRSLSLIKPTSNGIKKVYWGVSFWIRDVCFNVTKFSCQHSISMVKKISIEVDKHEMNTKENRSNASMWKKIRFEIDQRFKIMHLSLLNLRLLKQYLYACALLTHIYTIFSFSK